MKRAARSSVPAPARARVFCRAALGCAALRCAALRGVALGCAALRCAWLVAGLGCAVLGCKGATRPPASPPQRPADRAEPTIGVQARGQSAAGGSGRAPAPEARPAALTPGTAPAATEAAAPLRVLTSLDVPGYLPAVMAVPTGAAPPGGYRVVFVAHGAGGRAEHHCEFWDARLPADVWLLCPAGALLRRDEPLGGAYFADHYKLRAELEAVTAALAEAAGDRALSAGYTYIGYSQGATMGALALVGTGEASPREPSAKLARTFDRLILIEGGGEYWTRARALGFHKRGGQRVLLACGTRGCRQAAIRSQGVLEQAGVQATVIDAPGGGHTYGGLVGEALTPAVQRLFGAAAGSEAAGSEAAGP